MSLSVNINITEQDPDAVQLSIVGGEPYVLIRVADLDEDTEPATLDLELEVGGGARAEPADELAAFLRRVADFIDAGTEDAEDDASR